MAIKYPRSIRLNVPKVEARIRQLGMTENEFCRKRLGKGDAAILGHWKRGGKTYPGTARKLAAALGIDDWHDLWLDYVPPPKPQPISNKESAFEAILVQALIPGDRETVSQSPEQHDLWSVDFVAYLKCRFGTHIESLDPSPKEVNRVLTRWVDMGWLTKNKDNTFQYRYWTQTECLQALEFRITSEQTLMRCLAMLRNPDLPEFSTNILMYNKVINAQTELLVKMEKQHLILIQDDSEDAANRIVVFDDQFHQCSVGAPVLRTGCGFGLKCIDQMTHRFVETLRWASQRGISLRPEFPTLQHLVRRYYPQLSNIFAAFQKIETFSPNDEHLLLACKLLDEHAREGFDTARGAEKIISQWPWRPRGG